MGQFSLKNIKGHSFEMGTTVKDDLDGTIFAYNYITTRLHVAYIMTCGQIMSRKLDP